MADEKVMTEVELNVKVLAPEGMPPARVAELVKRLISAGEEDAANAPPGWKDKDLPDINALGEITVRVAEIDSISIKWSVGDVQSQCDTLTDDEAMEVLHLVERHHDATIGVTWDTLDSAIRHLYPEKLKEYQERDEDEEEDEEEDDDPVIPAKAHSDDRVFDADFDAVEWFEAATDDEIVALARNGWKDCQEADGVAQHCADDSTELAALFGYLEKIKDLPSKKDVCGYECAVDEDAARAWLDENKPHLILRIDNGDDDGGRDSAEGA